MKPTMLVNPGLALVISVAIAGLACAQDDEQKSTVSMRRGEAWRAQTSVCFVESFGVKSKGIGTGLLAESYIPGFVLLFSAKHVLEGKDSIIVTVTTYDSSDGYVPVSFTKRIEKNAANMIYVPDPNQDCGALLIDPTNFDRKIVPKGHKHYVLPRSNCIPVSELFAGIPVVIVGYPLGLRTQSMLPLLRKGSIAGIDLGSNTIYLDAQIFPGSSGSPVFLDTTQDLGRQLASKLGGRFIGLVWSAVPMRKEYVNLSYEPDRLSMSENSGIGMVVPADVLMDFVDMVARSYAEHKEKRDQD